MKTYFVKLKKHIVNIFQIYFTDQRYRRPRSRTRSSRRTLNRLRKSCSTRRRTENYFTDIGDASARFRTSSHAPLRIGARSRQGRLAQSFRSAQTVHRTLQRVELHGQPSKLHENARAWPGKLTTKYQQFCKKKKLLFLGFVILNN